MQGGWDDIDFKIQAGSQEVWTFVNLNEGHVHPMHLHLAEFQVSEETGRRLERLGGYWEETGETGRTLRRLRGDWETTGRRLEGDWEKTGKRLGERLNWHVTHPVGPDLG